MEGIGEGNGGHGNTFKSTFKEFWDSGSGFLISTLRLRETVFCRSMKIWYNFFTRSYQTFRSFFVIISRIHIKIDILTCRKQSTSCCFLNSSIFCVSFISSMYFDLHKILVKWDYADIKRRSWVTTS